MKQILYFDWHSEASEFYRALPLDYIKSTEFTITRSTDRDIKSHSINYYDVIVILRPSSETHLNLIKMAKDMGKKVISDWDDDPLHLQIENPMFGYYNGDKHHTIKCLTLVDEIWVATVGIKKSFRLYNKNIHVVPNSHNDIIFPVDKKRPFGIKKRVMWRGGGSHIGDIYQPGTTEWVVKTINNNKKWDFYWLGQRFEFIEYRVKHGNFHYNPGASTVQFYKLMQEINPQIFFYPLSDNLFNRSKSNCSWLESVYAGAAYFGKSQFPEFDKPGVLPLSSLNEYLRGDNSGELKEMNQLSWEYIKDNLLLSNVNKLREERLLNITS